jgi:hypothetical protein
MLCFSIPADKKGKKPPWLRGCGFPEKGVSVQVSKKATHLSET